MSAVIETKELAVLKTQTTKAFNRADELKITSQAELESATDILKTIKDAGKALKSKKEEITKPMNEALKRVREMFSPLEQQLMDAETKVKREMLRWNSEVDAAAKKAAEELEKQVEEGSISITVAAKQLEQMPEVQSKVVGKKGGIQYRTVRKVRPVDVTKTPKLFLEYPKVVEALTTAVRPTLLAGAKVEGWEVYEEQEVASV